MAICLAARIAVLFWVKTPGDTIFIRGGEKSGGEFCPLCCDTGGEKFDMAVAKLLWPLVGVMYSE